MLTPSPKISFEEWLACSELCFEWGDSYDDKDWDRLRAILAPTLDVDYTQVDLPKWTAMPAEDFIGMASHPGFLGDPLIHTQHHIGASKWDKVSDCEIVAHHQIRAAHQRYTGPDKQTVENKGHGHATIKHIYKNIDGVWKFAGLRPKVRWNEFAFEKIFVGLGDDHQPQDTVVVVMKTNTEGNNAVQSTAEPFLPIEAKVPETPSTSKEPPSGSEALDGEKTRVPETVTETEDSNVETGFERLVNVNELKEAESDDVRNVNLIGVASSTVAVSKMEMDSLEVRHNGEPVMV